MLFTNQVFQGKFEYGVRSEVFPSIRIGAIIQRNHMNVFIFVVQTFIIELDELQVVFHKQNYT